MLTHTFFFAFSSLSSLSFSGDLLLLLVAVALFEAVDALVPAGWKGVDAVSIEVDMLTVVVIYASSTRISLYIESVCGCTMCDYCAVHLVQSL